MSYRKAGAERYLKRQKEANEGPNNTVQSEDNEKKPMSGKKKFLIAMGITLGVFAAVYLGFAAYFSNHFYYNTKINGAEFSMKTKEEVQEYLSRQVGDYVLKMTESDGGIERISGKDIDLEYVDDNSVQKLLQEQDPLSWITALWEEPQIEAPIGVKFDEGKLKLVIDHLRCMDEKEQKPSISACPVFKKKQFEIQPEQIGTEIDREKFDEAVKTAINGFVPELNLEEAGCYILPKYTSESPEVAKARDEMNSYLGAEVTLDFTPYTEVVDASVISKWITVDDKMKVTFNQELVKDYIKGLAEKYDTYGKQKNFVTGFGKTVKVDNVFYGWQLDQETEYTALTENIKNGDVLEREPAFLKRAVTHEANDFGTTYAEVDLGKQHMFFFKDGQVALESDVVTGLAGTGRQTPQGVYQVAGKGMNVVLRGPKTKNEETGEEKYEWESPVTYWMPFNGGIGFHDANWRSEFGGSIYQWDGSHGCVNMPFENAKKLYELIEVGMPVIVHF